MKHILKGLALVMVFLGTYGFSVTTADCQTKIGVLFVVHGGMDTYSDQHMWDCGVQQFSYDHNNSVYKLVIWNPAMWDFVMKAESSIKFKRKLEFEYPRIGGTDPFRSITEQQLADMKSELDANPYGITFEVDWAAWMCGDCPEHYPYPRFIYYGPDGPGVGSNCTYCGEREPGGPWPGCNPHRYNVYGPVERLLQEGVSRIIMIDLTVGGVRFSKTYDVLQMTKRAIDDWNTAQGTSIPDPIWVNDYSNLMKRSYPIAPAGWTRSLLTPPTIDSKILKNGSPNPVASDPDLAALQREAVEAAMSGSVSDADTGVIILNHALHDLDQFFDPKMDDTIVLNENIKSQLLTLHPTLDPDNIIGARMGIRVADPKAEHTLLERTPEMRGENLGQQYLYETDRVFPSGGSSPFGRYHPWGYLYWDALDYLIHTKGVKHIVIGFTQIISSSVLDMVEIPNQIGKEIGIKNWARWNTGDFARYPVVGHPFADYWGNWVDTSCGEWELRFNNGTQQIAGGGTNPVTLDGAAKLVGTTSGATGEIKQVIVESGSWAGGNASGKIILKKLVGSFIDKETIHDDKGPPGNAKANGTQIQTISSNCCFVMGGCANDPLPRPYPPARLTPLPDRRHDMDPSLAYALSEYGHLGYNPALGAPDPDGPVQNQYTGTWEMYVVPDDDPRVGQLLAKHVINAAINPLVYLTSGELCSIEGGESVAWEAHIVSGTPAYSYEWSIKKTGDPDWTPVGGNSSSWIFSPGIGGEGIYAVRCRVTDSLTRSGEVIWEDFAVGDGDDDCVQNAEDNCPHKPNRHQENSDPDALGDVCDNCPTHYNPGQEDTDTDGVGNVCDNCSSLANPGQEDTMPPGGNRCGDACECEGNFDGDTDQDSLDAAKIKQHLGRGGFKNPCSNTLPCNGDFTCDNDVDSSDIAKFKSDYGRSSQKNPCPICVTTPWCVYP